MTKDRRSIHAGMAHSPVVLASYTGMAAAIAGHGTFTARAREVIALAVGNENGCDYCQAAHTLSARQAGFDDRQIIDIRAGEMDFDDRIGTIALVAHVAVNLFTNYFNHYAGTELDLPPAPGLPD